MSEVPLYWKQNLEVLTCQRETLIINTNLILTDQMLRGSSPVRVTGPKNDQRTAFCS